jgi:putative alpha-1,2-mannosidase
MIALVLSALLAQADPVSLVDPFVGTSGTKAGGPIDDFPGAAAPFGMVQWSPDTPAQPPGGGYDYNDSQITGFSLDHLSGPGCAVFGDFAMLPITGAPVDPLDAKVAFSHADERAMPGYYAVSYGNPAVRVEITVGERSGIARIAYPAGAGAYLLVNAQSDQAGVSEASLRILSPATIEGSATAGNFCGMPGTYTVYFAASFDRPIASSGMFGTDRHGCTSAARRRRR